MRSANYLEMTTTSIAGTLGDGAVTCTAQTNMPSFTTVFGSANRFVRYFIEDTVNKKFETGVGAVASNVLTRTRPQITWDGTTYKDGNSGAVTAIQFGSSPTSGNIKIRLTGTSEVISADTVHSKNSTLSGDANWRDWNVSRHIQWGNSAAGGAGGAITVNREYYQLYLNTVPGLLGGIQFELTTAPAGNIKTAMFDVGSGGLPGAKIVDFNVIASGGTTGIKSDTTTSTWSPTGGVWLVPGWYYIGFISDAGMAFRYQNSLQGIHHHTTPLGKASIDGYGVGLSYNAGGSYASGLVNTPDTLVSPASTLVGYNWIGLKVTP